MTKIGIDLGTTNTVVATIGTTGTRILDNKEGENMTPSVVSLRNEEIIVGSIAKKRLVVDPLNTIFSVKRLMGRGIKDEEVKKMKNEVPFKIIQPSDGTQDSVAVVLNNQEYSPVDISSKILSKIKSDVEFRLGEKVQDVVITVPAYFSEIQKHATREAGIIAGFNVLRILDEPTAAAISYGINEEGGTNETKIALVYDLGGGTFDISVLAITSGSVVQLNLEGDMWMGGDNFDKVIIDQVVEDLQKTKNTDARKDAKLMALLKSEAQKAKEILTSSRTADILIDYKGIEYDTSITRENFDRKIKHLIDKCDMLVDKAIKGAGFSGPDEIDIVIMAGNSTLIPAVQLSMESKFGKDKIKRKLHPKLCVAEGAAMAAAMVPLGEIICPLCNNANPETAKKCSRCGYKFIEEGSEAGVGVIPFSYGIERVGDIFDKYYEKNTQYPIKNLHAKSKSVPTNFDDQRMQKTVVRGGESEKASQNEFQGEVFSILPHGLPAGTIVTVKLWINKDGIFEVQSTLAGVNLDSIILRGKRDTRAVDICYTKLADYSAIKGQLDKETQARIEKQLEEALNYIKNKEYEKAIEAVNAIEIKGPGLVVDTPVSSGQIDPEMAMNLVNGLMVKYGDLVEPAKKYELGKLVENLSNAIQTGNTNQGAILANQIMNAFEQLMFMNIGGKVIPTPLGMIIQTEMMVMQAESKNPAQVRDLGLWERFEAAVEKLRHHDNSGANDLMSVLIAAQDIIGGEDPFQPGRQEGLVKCPWEDCGKMTPKNKMNCNYCSRPIILGAGDSKGFLKSTMGS